MGRKNKQSTQNGKKSNRQKEEEKQSWIRNIRHIVIILVMYLIFSRLNYSIALQVNYSPKTQGEGGFYWDQGEGYQEENSWMDPVEDGKLRFRISNGFMKQIRALRMELPVNGGKTYSIRSMGIYVMGVKAYEYPATELYKNMEVPHDIESPMLNDEQIWITVVGGDPYIVTKADLATELQKQVRDMIRVLSLAMSVFLYLAGYFIHSILRKKWDVIVAFTGRYAVEKMSVRLWIGYIFNVLLVIVTYLLFWMGQFLVKNFNSLTVDEIFFHAKVPMEGTGEGMIREGLKFFTIPLIAGGILFVLWVGTLIIFKRIRNNKLTVRCGVTASLVAGLIILGILANEFSLISFIQKRMKKSVFVEENYVAPLETSLTFPEKKRNLVYIYLESMESTFSSKEKGGSMEKDQIPGLTQLAEEHVNFSEDELVGGAYASTGTGWTMGGMVAQSSGLPLLIPIDGNTYGGAKQFLPGAVSLGEILQKEGYNQEIMVGSGIEFGGRGQYFSQHGGYQIWDYNTAITTGKIPEDYYEWWGVEDAKLYEYAKEEISKMAAEDEPFNFTMLTADTHHVGGYLCELCPSDSEVRYENVLHCASNQLVDFMEWLEEQDFYENTTIVVCGDHPTMDEQYIEEYYDGYKPRRVYNCFLNSAVSPAKEKNRNFTTMDLFPTTLVAMGIEIEGERLALGTNLFSDTPTLTEEYGYDMLEEELAKTSVFYNKEILGE